jgi:hypothetical protein
MKAQIVIKYLEDIYADCSYLGDLSESPTANSIKRRVSDLSYWNRRDWRGNYVYFTPMNSIEDNRKGLSKLGHSKHEAYTLANDYAMQDFNRLMGLYRGDWCYIGIAVDVIFNGKTIGHDSLWGIESDSDVSFFQETEQGCITEAIKSANDWLKKVGALESITETVIARDNTTF